MKKTLSIKPYSIKAWILAFRPKTLMAAVVPITVGSFLPGQPFSEMDWKIYFSALITAVSLTIGTNLVNDALDFKKGMDTDQRVGPIRVTQTGLLSMQAVLATGVAALLFALLFAAPLILKGGIGFLFITLVAILSGYLYTGGPYPLAYKGLGELFVFVFYGFAATCCPYYLQKGSLDLSAIVGSLQMGSLASVLLAINNLRDIKEDTLTGKRTLTVYFGESFGRAEVSLFLLSPFILNLYWLFQGRLLAFFLPLTTIFMAVNIIRCIYKTPPGKIYNRYLGEAALLMTLFGLLLLLGVR